MSGEGSYLSTDESESSYAKTTSSQRFIRETTMSKAAQRRVDRATCSNPELIGKRCLIENTDESNIVEYVHCLPRSTKGPLVSLPYFSLMTGNNLWLQLDSLEFAWNMPRFTLNVDSRYNIIRRRLSPNSCYSLYRHLPSQFKFPKVI